MKKICKQWLSPVVVACLALSFTNTGDGFIIKDNFESPTSTATYWPETSDNDPATPQVGQDWVVVESAPYFLQQVRHPQNLSNTLPSFAPPSDGGNQYLHTILSFEVGGNISQAWTPISAPYQAEISTRGTLQLKTELFALSGFDGWRGGVRMIGWDSAVTVKTSPAFDLRFVDGGYGVDGTVIYRDGTGDHTVPGLVFEINEWHNVIVDTNFSNDTFSVTLDGVKVDGLTWAGGNLSKIQSVSLSPGNPIGASSYRGGFDNLSMDVPEPAAGSLLALAGMTVLVRRRKK